MESNVTYSAVEKYRDIHLEMDPIFEKHYKEISHYHDIELCINKEAYFAMEDSGWVRLFTARINGKLVGYNAFFIRYNAHYAKSLQASNDVVYIDPEHRGFGRDFIKWCDDQLREMGIQVVYHHVKAKHNFGPMLERMGYELIDLIYGKRLDRGN